MVTDQPPVLRVLAVCTGNVCRSPAIERLLAGWLGGAGLVVTSAGTHALVGRAMTAPMADLVAAAGGDPGGFVSRQLTEDMVGAADLVLTATRAHRGHVVTMHPPALRRTFTLREFVRLARGVDPLLLPPRPAVARLRALIPPALDARAGGEAGRAEDDVDDPYGHDDATYRRSFGQLRQAVHGILDLAVG